MSLSHEIHSTINLASSRSVFQNAFHIQHLAHCLVMNNCWAFTIYNRLEKVIHKPRTHLGWRFPVWPLTSCRSMQKSQAKRTWHGWQWKMTSRTVQQIFGSLYVSSSCTIVHIIGVLLMRMFLYAMPYCNICRSIISNRIDNSLNVSNAIMSFQHTCIHRKLALILLMPRSHCLSGGRQLTCSSIQILIWKLRCGNRLASFY